jgi:hypothetical protein
LIGRRACTVCRSHGNTSIAGQSDGYNRPKGYSIHRRSDYLQKQNALYRFLQKISGHVFVSRFITLHFSAIRSATNLSRTGFEAVDLTEVTTTGDIYYEEFPVVIG